MSGTSLDQRRLPARFLHQPAPVSASPALAEVSRGRCLSDFGVHLLFGAFALFIIGCQALSLATASPSPAVATTLVIPLYRQVTLVTKESTERGQPYDYTITLRTPNLTGSDDPRVRAFNEEMDAIVNTAAAQFKQDLAGVPPTPISAGSSFDVRFELTSPPGDIFSIKFEMEGYVTGAAHPYHISRTANFDLEHGRDLALSELFKPGSDYLQLLSSYCISQLSSRDLILDEISAGAAPTSENYRNWNITADGFLITFDEYQVAPYAAGPQIVSVPYAELKAVLLEPGPLSPYLP